MAASVEPGHDTHALWTRRAGPAVAGAAWGVGYVLAYIALDWLSYVQPVLKLGITPWNPQAGLTLAFLLLRGPIWMPLSVLAAYLAEIVVRGTPAPAMLLLASSLWIGTCYALLAALLRSLGVNERLRSLQTAARIAMSAGIAAMVVAAGYVGLFVVAGSLDPHKFVASTARYWVGDFNGILLVTPLLLATMHWRGAWPQFVARRSECLAQAVTLVICVWLIFGLEGSDRLRFFYPLFVPVIWIALRWGAGGALLGILAIQVGLILAVQDARPVVPLLDMQFLMLTLALTGLMLGAAVTERADALAQVAAGAAEVRALLATAPDAVLTTDAAGHLRSANHAARSAFGLEKHGELHGVRLTELLPGIALLSREGRATLAAQRPDGATFPADVAWVQLEAPAATGWLAIVRDATDRRLAQAQARERDTLLARAMRFAVAGELASALAHELNQPITALVSYLRAAQILSAPLRESDERLGRTLEKAGHEAERAAAVLRRLRDFYLGGSGKIVPVAIPALFAMLAESFEDRLRADGVTLSLQIEDGLPTLNLDATRLEIVLQNLIGNAIDALAGAASGSRRIELRAARRQEQVVIEVEDSGPGVPTEGLSELFEPLNTSKPDGMGLGLAISRSLVRAQGGELSYRRGGVLGGALFAMSLPVARR
jgi:PAS domain S-box-containing protein